MSCGEPPASAAAEKVPQTITIKQVGCAPTITPCPDTVYPVAVGSAFYVTATSDSGLPVRQQVIAGDVAPRAGSGTQAYVVTGPGNIVIRATQDGDADHSAAAPVELILTTAPPNSNDTCSGLFGAPTATKQATINVSQLITLAGNPTPFVLAAQGSDTILIYSSRFPLTPRENGILSGIHSSLEQFAGRTAASLGLSPDPDPFKVELRIPHAAALGDLASKINTLNYSDFSVQDVGNDSVRITSKKQPDCDAWKNFLSAIRRVAWQITPTPLDMKLYFLSGSDVVNAFNTLASTGGGSGSGGSSPAPSPAGGSSSGGGGGAASPTIAINQPPGSRIDVKSDTTPCVIAGLELSNSSACAPASGTGGGSSSGSGGSAGLSGGGGATPSAPKPPGMATLGAAVAGGVQQLPDLLVFFSANPGDEGQVEERKRILAQLDLPRPEMVISAWVMQNSTADASAIGKFSNAIRNLVVQYNDAIEGVVDTGWKTVQDQIQSNDYFNQPFFHYVSDLYVAGTQGDSAPAGSTQAATQRILDASAAKLADSPASLRNDYGVCTGTQYCLGYRYLFQPLKPRLTDLLLTLIAADKPTVKSAEVIAKIQGERVPDNRNYRVHQEDMCAPDQNRTLAKNRTSAENRTLEDRCKMIFVDLGLRDGAPTHNCAVEDYEQILDSMLYDSQTHVQLVCFAQAAKEAAPRFPLLRGVIANFLYQYKQSQQYPHEFGAYDLSQSADALNAALAPLIDAFSRDIVAFQTFMRADVQYKVERLNSEIDQRCCVGRLFGRNKPSFYNEGLVSVRTISGVQSQINTTSQSVLNASSAPSLSDILSNISSASGSSNAASTAAALGGPQASVSLLAGIVNAYQTTRVQIGRQLNLTATPRSLATASAAEISVNLTADESATPAFYSSGPSTSQNQTMSRVGTHETTTRIRVESLKLFEVSSYAAVVQRSQSKFPIIPPFIEIPYLGTLAGIPIPAAKEYHGSTAILSAMVVPTAADIAYGLKFDFDLVVGGENKAGDCSFLKDSAGTSVTDVCRFNRAVSITDLKGPIRNFHEAMVNCLETGMKAPYSSYSSLTNTNTATCENLSFDSVRR